jgi:pyrroline-5-carboxylate reductase
MSESGPHILLAGYGNMGRALVAGWLASNAPGRRITVVDASAQALDAARELGLATAAPGESIPSSVDVAVLAVKPALLATALAALPPASLYISIAAGRTLAEIEAAAGGGVAVVRAMPNTPAAIGLGITGLCANAVASAADRATAEALLEAVGAVEWLDDEADMDALTAVSGSGPAYVFLLIEALTAAAVEAGLEPARAARLATATVRGAGAYAAASTLDAASLRRQVTSPGGTTEAALAVLQNEAALERLVATAVRAAAAKSRDLRTDSGNPK